MDTLSRLSRAAKSPTLFARYANRLYHRRLNQRRYNPYGVDIFAEDWDNLLVLDACRYDMFERYADLPGRLEYRDTRGTSTTEFLKANFAGRDLRDTVYVTANPQLYYNREEIDADLHRVMDVWQEEGWNDEYGTVLLETVTEHAIRAAREYPKKRLIVHYIQPHYPFIGSDTEFDKRHLVASDTGENGNGSENVWGQLMTGTLDATPANVWQPHVANLKRALPHVEELLSDLGGQTVVTADHGNMLGKRSFPLPIREWGHPQGIYTNQLVRVPWLVFESGPRREIYAGDSASRSGVVDDDVVADRLRDLGYMENPSSVGTLSRRFRQGECYNSNI
jgi:hypothetical protein